MIEFTPEPARRLEVRRRPDGQLEVEGDPMRLIAMPGPDEADDEAPHPDYPDTWARIRAHRAELVRRLDDHYTAVMVYGDTGAGMASVRAFVERRAGERAAGTAQVDPLSALMTEDPDAFRPPTTPPR